MKAVILHGINELRLEDVDEPDIEETTDVIIKVNLSSICGGDLHIKKIGLLEPGKIIGHEYCGTVVKTGSQVVSLKEGDRVIGKPFFHCGRCYWCLHNQPQLCEKATVFGIGRTNGVQAEYARIPYADNTLKVIPEGIADEDALLVCDLLATGYTGLKRPGVSMGDSVAIFGDGSVGLSAAMCASLFGVSLVILVGQRDFRLEFARKLGAIAVNTVSVDPVATIRGLTDDRGADLGIEAAGYESSLNTCLQSVRRGGKVDILGIFHEKIYFNIAERSQDVFHLSMGLGDLRYVDALLSLVKSGKLKPKTLITHRLPLFEALQGYEILERKTEGAIKVILKC